MNLTCVWYSEYLYRLTPLDQLLADFQVRISPLQKDMPTRTLCRQKLLSNGQMVILISGSSRLRNLLQETLWLSPDWQIPRIAQILSPSSKEAELSTTSKATYSKYLNKFCCNEPRDQANEDHATLVAGSCDHSPHRELVLQGASSQHKCIPVNLDQNKEQISYSLSRSTAWPSIGEKSRQISTRPLIS